MIVYTPKASVFSPRETLLQGFAAVARWSMGVGGCAGEDGRGQNVQNARPKTRGWLLDVPAVAINTSLEGRVRRDLSVQCMQIFFFSF